MSADNKTIPIDNTIYFSGYKWIVANSPNEKSAPGNNYWSDESVWVDAHGHLHLRLTKDTKTGKWFCAQVKSENKFGNGLYEFVINGRIDQLDKNVVFGLFNYSGIDYHDEIDIEFSRWGNEKNESLHYTVYPEENSKSKTWGSSTELAMSDAYSTHRFKRTKTSVAFESIYDHKGQKTHTQTYLAPHISQKKMPIYINLWTFKNLPPSNLQEVELIVEKFVFTK